VRFAVQSGSPQGVSGAGTGAVTDSSGAWADVPMMDIETGTPITVAAMAAVIVEPMKRSSMIVSFWPRIEFSRSAPIAGAAPAIIDSKIKNVRCDRRFFALQCATIGPLRAQRRLQRVSAEFQSQSLPDSDVTIAPDGYCATAGAALRVALIIARGIVVTVA
jgi:hypothetical protein